MYDDRNAFLGTGWSFPPSFDQVSNSVRMASELADIEESIYVILTTMPGERVMQPEFGCYISRLVFDNINAGFLTELNDMLALALLKFEPRIKFQHAHVIQQNIPEGIVHIRIDFSVIITNTRHNIVYPYYFEEGTNIRELV